MCINVRKEMGGQKVEGETEDDDDDDGDVDENLEKQQPGKELSWHRAALRIRNCISTVSSLFFPFLLSALLLSVVSCSICKHNLSKDEFTSSQLNKGKMRKCKKCIQKSQQAEMHPAVDPATQTIAESQQGGTAHQEQAPVKIERLDVVQEQSAVKQVQEEEKRKEEAMAAAAKALSSQLFNSNDHLNMR